MENKQEIVNNSKNILISIIVIVRNEGKRIGFCIDSLVRQKEIEKCEIIFVDGNSTDNTTLIINQYLQKYCNLRLIKCNNYGYSYQRNVGIHHAKGEYILFISGDTVCDPKLIFKYLRGICKGYEVIQGTVIQEGDDEKTNILYKFYHDIMKNNLEEISTVNILIKKNLFQNSMFDERIIASEDKIWFLMLNNEIRYYRMKNCVVFHSVHESISQYSRKIYKEAVGIGISLALHCRMWKKHNYFGWLSATIYGCCVGIILFVTFFVYILIGNNPFVLGIGIAALFSYEIYKVRKYRLYENNLEEILILKRYLFYAQKGIIKGIIKGLLMRGDYHER